MNSPQSLYTYTTVGMPIFRVFVRFKVNFWWIAATPNTEKFIIQYALAFTQALATSWRLIRQHFAIYVWFPFIALNITLRFEFKCSAFRLAYEMKFQSFFLLLLQPMQSSFCLSAVSSTDHDIGFRRDLRMFLELETGLGERTQNYTNWNWGEDAELQQSATAPYASQQ